MVSAGKPAEPKENPCGGTKGGIFSAIASSAVRIHVMFDYMNHEKILSYDSCTGNFESTAVTFQYRG